MPITRPLAKLDLVPPPDAEPGVLRIGNLRSRKRTKISLRIPAAVAEEEREIIDGHEVARILQVTYSWVIKHSDPRKCWHIPSSRIGKFRRFRRSAALAAVAALEKSGAPVK